MRILGIDYGEKRIGVSLCDELGIAAHALTVIHRRDITRDIDSLVELVTSNNVEKIVIGYPVRLNGEEGIQCQKVNNFILLLEQTINIPIIRENEAFSTVEAQTTLRETKTKRKKHKSVIDKIAACFILQTYLEREAYKRKQLQAEEREL